MPCYVVPGLDQDLTPDPLAPEQIISGNPQVSVHELLDGEDVSVGIWQHTAGVSTDVEADEIFVVLRGRATIEVSDGPTLEVGVGDDEGTGVAQPGHRCCVGRRKVRVRGRRRCCG